MDTFVLTSGLVATINQNVKISVLSQCAIARPRESANTFSLAVTISPLS